MERFFSRLDLSARPLEGKDGVSTAKDIRFKGEEPGFPLGAASPANNLLVWRKSALLIICIGWAALIATGEIKVAVTRNEDSHEGNLTMLQMKRLCCLRIGF